MLTFNGKVAKAAVLLGALMTQGCVTFGSTSDGRSSSDAGGVPPPAAEANPVVVEVGQTLNAKDRNSGALMAAAAGAATQALLQRQYRPADADAVRRARTQLGLQGEGFMSEGDRRRFGDIITYGSWVKVDITRAQKERVQRNVNGRSRTVDAWSSTVSCSWARRDGTIAWNGTGKCDEAEDLDTAVRNAVTAAFPTK